MHEHDVKTGVYNGSYEKNPTAKKLTDMINGNYIGNKNTNEKGLPYVIDMDDNIIVGKRNGNGRGKDPKVKMAGLIEIRGGKIYD